MAGIKNNEGVLPIAVFPTDAPGQFVITRPDDSLCPPGMEWDDYYVNFSGYFGSYGPSIFAAAPELLAALKDATDRLERAMISSGTDAEFAVLAVAQFRAAIAKATGEAQ